MKLFCLFVGENGAAFSVNISDPTDTVDDLKDAIRAKKINDLSMVDADNLTLYTTKRGDEWLKPKSDDAKRVTGSLEKAGDWLMEEYELDPTDEIGDVFAGELSKSAIHVLVKVPVDITGKFSVIQARKHSMLVEMARQQEEDERKQRELEEKRARDARVPPKRKRAWEELNQVLVGGEGNKKFKSRLRPFSSVGEEQLPPRCVPVKAKSESEFFKLLNNPTALSEAVLAPLMETMKRKKRVYTDISANEATRVQFMSGVFEHIVDEHVRDDDPMRIAVEERLKGEFVKAQGRVDFLFTRGGDRVCVVEAKDWNFHKGSVQSVLGMEVLVDLTGKEIMYGIVTNYTEWRFLKRTDDGIEFFSVFIDGEDVTSGLKRVAECVQAVLMA